MLPPECQAACSRLLGGGPSWTDEGEAVPLMEWIDEQGRAHGVRIPTMQERVTSTGRADYLNGLGPSGVAMYNLVGNHFDVDALRGRIESVLQGWRPTASERRWALPTPMELAVQYRALVRRARGPGIRTEAHPFPPDLRTWLSGLHEETQPVGDPTQGGGAKLPRQRGK